MLTRRVFAGVDEMWAVYFQPEGLPAEDDILQHAFLFLNEKSGTKVLRTGEELDETDPSQVDFILSSRTVLAGNVLNNSRIVQVFWHLCLTHIVAACIAAWTCIVQSLRSLCKFGRYMLMESCCCRDPQRCRTCLSRI